VDHWKIGIRCFNRGDYWKAHEEWEQVWKTLPNPERGWIQGLIQAAATFYLLEKKRRSPAHRLCERALTKLEGWPASRSSHPKIRISGLKPLLKSLAKLLAKESPSDAKIAQALIKAKSLKATLSTP
jgi:predicted metal-dependent hydrolase